MKTGMCAAYFFWFFLDEKESLKGITVFVGRLAGCLHTSRITTKGVNSLTSVSFSARLRLSKSKTELAPVMPSVSRLDKVKGFQGFCSNNPLNFCFRSALPLIRASRVLRILSVATSICEICEICVTLYFCVFCDFCVP